jgi:hypothetical protein
VRGARARQQLAGNALVSRPRQRRAGVAQRAIVAEAATKQVTRRPVPLELEKGELPMNTFNNKKPFKATIKSVERIVGPKATGETCHIILETKGEIPFWEGQSYGIVPPVGAQPVARLSKQLCCRDRLPGRVASRANATCVEGDLACSPSCPSSLPRARRAPR